jgi:hypothetical protein
MVVMEKMKASEANLECHYSIDELVLSPCMLIFSI